MRFEGKVLYKGRDLMELSQDDMREVRGKEIAMIFQDPMTSLNPVYTVGWQIEEQISAHQTLEPRAPPARGDRAAAARSASPTRSRGSTTTRTSSPAACASA